MADISGDANMIEAFAEGADIHQATAAKIFHEPLEQVTDGQRRQAKTANFGIIYGISAFGLAERLGISRQEAKTLIEGYFASYPGVKEYMTSTVERARETGYVTTVMGRRRMLPEINSRSAVVRGYAERNAINAPLQGSAADIIKVAMVNIHRRMKQEMFCSTLIMQVHDELIFNVVDGELPALQQLVISEMESAYHGKVPLTVSAGVASNWLDAH
jgi:DNA polymerase-1